MAWELYSDFGSIHLSATPLRRQVFTLDGPLLTRVDVYLLLSSQSCFAGEGFHYVHSRQRVLKILNFPFFRFLQSRFLLPRFIALFAARQTIYTSHQQNKLFRHSRYRITLVRTAFLLLLR